MFNAIGKFFTSLYNDFYSCFLKSNTYKMYLIGLRNTVFIALGACLLGLIIGIIVTCIRIMPSDNFLVKLLKGIAKLYVTVIRGTPVVLQLFIGYFVIFATIKSMNVMNIKNTVGIPIACLVFGINSGAYMSEILRGGINAVDYGQMEAGRALGLSWISTFFKIVLPQALKSAVPTMFNEFITLVKETSVAGYVGIVELTKIQSYVTTQQLKLYMPLFIIAVIYLIIVVGLEQVQKAIEKKVMKGDRRKHQ